MAKLEILIKLNDQKGKLIGSTRPANSIQLDKWKLEDKIYMVTSFRTYNDNEVRYYSMSDRLELLTEID